MSTPDINDEMLVALADGEMGEVEAGKLRAQIEADPELAQRYADFVETRALLSASFGSAADEQIVPSGTDPIAAMILASANAQEPIRSRPQLKLAASNESVPASGTQKTAPRHLSGRTWWQLPAAAAIAFVCGLAGANLLPSTETDRVIAGIDDPAFNIGIAELLAKLPSGKTVELAAGQQQTRLTMIATHRVENGETCREYRLERTGASRHSEIRVSCRHGETWTTTLVAAEPAQDGGFATASAAAETAEQFLATLGSAGPLSDDDEKTALGLK